MEIRAGYMVLDMAANRRYDGLISGQRASEGEKVVECEPDPSDIAPWQMNSLRKADACMPVFGICEET